MLYYTFNIIKYICVKISWWMGWIYYIDDNIINKYFEYFKKYIDDNIINKYFEYFKKFSEENLIKKYNKIVPLTNEVLIHDKTLKELSIDMNRELEFLKILTDDINIFDFKNTKKNILLSKLHKITLYIEIHNHLNSILDYSFLITPLESDYFTIWSSYQHKHSKINSIFCKNIKTSIKSFYLNKEREFISYPINKLNEKRLVEVSLILFSIYYGKKDFSNLNLKLLKYYEAVSSSIDKINNFTINEKPIIKIIKSFEKFNHGKIEYRNINQYQKLFRLIPVIPWSLDRLSQAGAFDYKLIEEIWNNLLSFSKKYIRKELGNITNRSS